MSPANLLSLGMLALCATVSAAGPDVVTANATPEFERRLAETAAELASLRERVALEKAPLAQAMRALEDEILELQSEVAQLEIARSGDNEQRLQAAGRWELAQKHFGYMTTLLQESLQGLRQGLRPGESATLTPRIDALQDRLERSRTSDVAPAWEASDLLIEQLQSSLGGYTAAGDALIDGTNRLVSGTIAQVGPETFFLPGDGSAAGILRARAGAPYPTFHHVRGWTSAEAALFFRGEAGSVVLDASGGKAARLAGARGGLVDHIRMGGSVGYVILGLGGLAILISILKLFDLRRLAVDPPDRTNPLIQAILTGGEDEVKAALSGLRQTSRELCTAALRYWQHPRDVLQEHLYSIILQHRLRFQRRLPLLAVIVTAAPLLGLLGTVTGMIKTFSLITVYGTGNAARLSSGISEALVTTELGLIVAIPTLVVHGFFAHRTKKGQAQLERCSYQLVTAAEESRAQIPAPLERA